MRKLLIFGGVLLIGISGSAQTLNDVWNKAKNNATNAATTTVKDAKDAVGGITGGGESNSLSNDEVIKALREALTIGTNTATGMASQLDGYYKNPRLFIPWPDEAKDMKAKLVKLGMQKKVNEFETSLNRAAEEAAKNAAPIFIDAITGMSIGDGFAILKGEDTAATNYLRKSTYSPLYDKFLPVAQDAIKKAQVAKYWKPLVTKYNKLPGVKKQNPNLDDYVTKKAINGLFILVADQEAKIRKDPVAQVTDLLKKVFGSVKK